MHRKVQLGARCLAALLHSYLIQKYNGGLGVSQLCHAVSSLQQLSADFTDPHVLLPLKADQRVQTGVAVAAFQETLPLKCESWVDQLLCEKSMLAMSMLKKKIHPSTYKYQAQVKSEVI